MTRYSTPIESPPAMLYRAGVLMAAAAERGEDLDALADRLLDVADRWVTRWSDLADRVAAGEHLDGRASIYTGETYAEARDRWLSYAAALHAHLNPQEATA